VAGEEVKKTTGAGWQRDRKATGLPAFGCGREGRRIRINGKSEKCQSHGRYWWGHHGRCMIPWMLTNDLIVDVSHVYAWLPYTVR